MNPDWEFTTYEETYDVYYRNAIMVHDKLKIFKEREFGMIYQLEEDGFLMNLTESDVDQKIKEYNESFQQRIKRVCVDSESQNDII